MLNIRNNTAALTLILSAALALPALADDRNEFGYAAGSALVSGLSGSGIGEAQAGPSRVVYSVPAATQTERYDDSDSQILSAWQDIVSANERGEPLVVARADTAPAGPVSGYSLADALAEAQWRKRAMDSLRSLDD